jgi:hypothetical protein
MPETDDQKKHEKAQAIHAVIDRIEDGRLAVLLLDYDGQTQIDLPLSLLPEGAAGGDHLSITIAQDKGSRAAAEDRIRKMQEQLAQSTGAQEQKDFKL